MSKKFCRMVFPFVLFLFSFQVFPQNSGEAASAQQAGGSPVVSLSEDPSRVDVSSLYENDASEPARSNSTSTVGLVLRMIVVLALVLVCVYALMAFMKKSSGTADTDDSFLRKVSQVSLAPGKSVQIVTVLDHAYIVGVSDNAVNLIGEITDKEIVDSMNLMADRTASVKRPMSFADILDILAKPKGSRRTTFSDFTKNAADSLKQQRENFNSRGN